MRKSRLGGSGDFFNEPEQNPMEGVANLVDAMLVLACGLMMAIISFYNVDIKGQSSAKELKKEEIREINDYGIVDSEGNVSGGFESRGKVYEDKKTGKLYVVTQEDSEEDSDNSTDNAEKQK